MFGPLIDKIEVPSDGGLKVGDYQTFTFPKNSTDPSLDGPKALSKEERIEKKHPKPLPLKQGKRRKKEDLKRDFVARKVISDDSKMKLGELQQLAHECEPPIPTHEPATPRATKRPRTKPELFSELLEKGLIRPNRTRNLEELQDVARQANIPIEKDFVPMTNNWDGAPNSIFQILYETDWIDPIYLRGAETLQMS